MLRKYLIFLYCLYLSIGCAPHIPTSEHPMEIKRVFHASFDKTWDSVLEVVKTSKGTVITKDRSSGLIVYKISNGEIYYMNVYLKDSAGINATLVYLVRTGYYLKEIERDFFEKLEKNLTKK